MKKQSKSTKKIPIGIKPTFGLCFRCEHRAKFLEGEGFTRMGDEKSVPRPRCECGDIESSKHSCYMFTPVKPLIMAKDKQDRRPQFGGWMFTSRSSSAGVPEDLVVDGKKYKDGVMIYWRPSDVTDTILRGKKKFNKVLKKSKGGE